MHRWRGARRRGERGAVALVAGLVTMTLLGVCAFVVDIGMTWERRGDLQQQADKAALFAAEALPATDDATRLRVAKRAAFYIACHQVLGQDTLDPTIPDCPSSTSSSSLNSYAERLLAENLVTFPSSTQVRVVTPLSEVRFAFAGVTGVEESIQRKAATAKVSSPGELLPVGLSLHCLAGVVNNAGLGSSVDGILPLSYITPGSYTTGTTLDPDTEPPLLPWETAYSGAQASNDAKVLNATSSGSVLTLEVDSPGLLPGLGDLLAGSAVVFKRGGTTIGPIHASSLELGTGVMVVPIPSEVLAEPGIWHVKAKLNVSKIPLLGTNFKWSANHVQFSVFPSQESVVGRLLTSVGDMLNLRDFLACGRLLDSPRVRDGGSPALTRNLQEGLDHSLTANQALVQALATQNLSQLNGTAGHLATTLGTVVDGILSNPMYGLLGCAGTAYNRLDTPQTWQATQSAAAPPANCVRIRSDAATEQEFTDGLLKDSPSSPTEPGYGRLSCQREGACAGATTSLPGFSGTYNDDGFADFLRTGSNTVLDSNLAFALDTYLLPGLPVVTPSDAILPEIYSSPRFGWVPVLSYVDLNSAGSVDYPILTFRPLFIDNGSAQSLNILGLDLGGVVDGLGQHLEQALTEALGVVETSLGVLGSVLGSVIGTLGVDAILDKLGQGDVDEALGTLGSALGTDMGEEEAGLLLQDGKLKAARFMTVAPDALPPVSKDYQGPVTDYLGVGPKIVRLVR